MPRYINSADVLHTLKTSLYETALNQDDLRYAEVFEDIAKNRVETWVDLMPTANVVERKRGKWMFTDAAPHRVYCSECYKTYIPNREWVAWKEDILPRNFCPYCGSQMNGVLYEE